MLANFSMLKATAWYGRYVMVDWCRRKIKTSASAC